MEKELKGGIVVTLSTTQEGNMLHVYMHFSVAPSETDLYEAREIAKAEFGLNIVDSHCFNVRW